MYLGNYLIMFCFFNFWDNYDYKSNYLFYIMFNERNFIDYIRIVEYKFIIVFFFFIFVNYRVISVFFYFEMYLKCYKFLEK